MDVDTGYELVLGMIIVFLVFNYLSPGVYTGLVFLAGLVGAFYLVYGVLDFVRGNGVSNFWAGVMIIVILAVLFKGMQVVLNGLSLILGFLMVFIGLCVKLFSFAV